MKTIFLAILFAATSASGSIMADGRSFFPVLIQVVDAQSGSPIRGVTVRLDDLGQYHELEMDPSKVTKVIPGTLGKPVLTDDKGVAVVFYHGGFSTFSENGKTTYNRSFNGTVVVIHDGKEIFRSKLKDWVTKNDDYPGGFSAPWIVVPVQSAKKKEAQQEGTGRPATRPADRAPEKDQPSTPTSKDAPR